jgi:hypothetical protein
MSGLSALCSVTGFSACKQGKKQSEPAANKKGRGLGGTAAGSCAHNARAAA